MRGLAVFFVVIAAIMMIFMGRAKADVLVIVDISDQVMVVDTGYDQYVWPVSTARQGYHTPRGVYQPTRMEKIWYSKKYDNAPMPNSIFFHGGYAIHATYDVHRLGRPASHGCIRLAPQDAQWLYQLIKEEGPDNTTIVIQD